MQSCQNKETVFWFWGKLKIIIIIFLWKLPQKFTFILHRFLCSSLPFPSLLKHFEIYSMTDAKGELVHGLIQAVMYLECQHLYLATFLLPDSKLWMWQKDITHPVPYVLFFYRCVGSFWSHSQRLFVWFRIFVVDIFELPACHLPTSCRHSSGRSAPLAVVYNNHPGGWTIKDSSLHIT